MAEAPCQAEGRCRIASARAVPRSGRSDYLGGQPGCMAANVSPRSNGALRLRGGPGHERHGSNVMSGSGSRRRHFFVYSEDQVCLR